MPKHAISGATALLLTTAIAHAEVDARTIWTDWQEVSARFGGALTAASEDYSNGTLTLTDMMATTTMDGAESRIEYGTVRLVEGEDGTVTIELPESLEMTTTNTVGEVTQTQDLAVRYQDLEIVVSEEEGVRVYDAEAESMTMTTAVAPEDGSGGAELVVTMSGIDSTYRSGTDGDDGALEQTLAADGLELRLAVEDEGGAPVAITSTLEGITGTFDGNLGEMPDLPVTSMAQWNMTYQGGLRHDGGTFRMDGEGPQGPFSVDGTSDTGNLDFSLTEDSMGYRLGAEDVAMTVQAPGFPVPIRIAVAESETGFTLPFGEPGTEKPFGMTLAYRDLVIDDALWALFDPTGQLPRDPATLVVELAGTATPSVDIFGDPEAMATLQGPPGTLDSLTIERILLDLVGATLRGSGELAFPTPDPSQPVGTIELSLDGGFALIDKLVALGFVPAEQAAFVKGMAGAVAKPVGDDQLETVIEFTEGGGISANGLPLQ
ncbi:DUF2125 domain-containing protein [Jannaschia sp. S6380]|uniref:DUF2125 domain-containing protein n=1 Tax=Jannaschia sp. S6380 TaxID=2926408 RepID=UPI001FF1D2B8|nr:DUF2125 domain-containing protein [Jannaschia sp. S6380]MCK0168721.1 DUF2125 domain-containing protein [Jannaschia sp. S6380]